MQNVNDITNEQIAHNHVEFQQRLAYYNNLGIDHIKLRTTIMDMIDCNPAKILEVGTGKGILTIFLAKICNSIISVDLDAEEQCIALLNLLYHQCAESVSLLCTDAGNLDYPDKNFDLVVSAISFHHFENPKKVIDEMARLAAKQLIITDFTEHGFDILERAHQQENRHHDRTEHSFAQVPQWLEQHGFSFEVYADDCQTVYCAKRNGTNV